MQTPPAPPVSFARKPISVGLTCWLWQRGTRAITNLAGRTGVTLEVQQRVHGLRRVIDCKVSGGNVDRFISEFMRQG